MRIYYFGCHGKPGHHLYEPDMRMTYRTARSEIPWTLSELDGFLCPKLSAEPEGRALLHHRNGWSVLAFWDRSADRRLASNSAFLVDQELEFEAMMELSREHFPEVFRRFYFQIQQEA